VRLLARGDIDVKPLTTSVMALAEHEAAFAALRDPEASIKILLDPTA
jgi:threonine dehydrogenase-like Zn-dependent dehydrogenase